MAKRKTVYSVWYRNLLRKSKIKKLDKEKEYLLATEQQRKSLIEENEEKKRILQTIQEDDEVTRKKRSEILASNGMIRDFSRESNTLNIENETPEERKKRLKDQAKIEKARKKQLAKEEKEKKKALFFRAKAEGDAKKYESDSVDEDNRLRLNVQRKMINMQRDHDREERRSLNAHARNEEFEIKARSKSEQILKKKADKLLAEEYRKQERLKREQEDADRKIEAKRRKASGDTLVHRLKEKFRTLVKIYSFQNLKDTINTYGYSYSIEEFLKQTLMIVVVVSVIAWYSKIRGFYLFAVICITVLSIPFLLYSWFNQLFNSKRFEMVQSYLSNVLPIFMQKPKIRYALQEVKEMASGQMENAIDHAINYIDTTTDDENVMETALTFIENEFPNSRIKAVHKLLLNIEYGNSSDYTSICENMYTDIEGWIRRVYGFQKDLKSRRNSLIILCLFSLGLNAIFTVMYDQSEIFNGFTDRTLFQVSTMLFILAILLTAALLITKLHGAWLIYDSNEKEETENIRAYTYIHMNTTQTSKQDWIVAGSFALIGLLIYFVFKNVGGLVMLFLAYFVVTKAKRSWNTKHKRVSKALMLEFPVWLRGVALNLHEMTVIRSIEESKKTCSYCMKKEIDKFFDTYNKNPTSIKAFNEFLAEYKIEDVQATMKVLFTIQSMSNNEIKNQIAMLIARNQELLTKTETIQNQDSLGLTEALGYMPMVLLTIQLLMSMVLMFIHIMEYMDMVMSQGLR